MSSEVEVIYEKVPIGAKLVKNAENDNSVLFKYVKLHFKQLLWQTLFDKTPLNRFSRPLNFLFSPTCYKIWGERPWYSRTWKIYYQAFYRKSVFHKSCLKCNFTYLNIAELSFSAFLTNLAPIGNFS